MSDAVQNQAESLAPTVLAHGGGEVIIDEIGAGRRRVSIVPRDASTFVPCRSCETSYPLELLRRLLEVHGLAWLCDAIRRDESADYVSRTLRYVILPFFDESAFAGRRILDFGCGSGASSSVLGRMFPEAEIVGVDLQEQLLSIARLRREHYGLTNVSFLPSPSGDRLPPFLSRFDFIFLSAVWEHLLPHERRVLLPALWKTLVPGGTLFLNETPHRWSPIEKHTTGLPLLNYFSDRLALAFARRVSRRISNEADWPSLLRAGIRGGTQQEVLRMIREEGGRPVLLQPRHLGLHDAADVWYAAGEPSTKRKLAHAAFKGFNRLPGRGVFVPSISIAISKAE